MRWFQAARTCARIARAGGHRRDLRHVGGRAPGQDRRLRDRRRVGQPALRAGDQPARAPARRARAPGCRPPRRRRLAGPRAAPGRPRRARPPPGGSGTRAAAGARATSPGATSWSIANSRIGVVRDAPLARRIGNDRVGGAEVDADDVGAIAPAVRRQPAPAPPSRPHVELDLPAFVAAARHGLELERADLGDARLQAHRHHLAGRAALGRQRGRDRRRAPAARRAPRRRAASPTPSSRRTDEREEAKAHRLADHQAELVRRQLGVGALLHAERRHAQRLQRRLACRAPPASTISTPT